MYTVQVYMAYACTDLKARGDLYAYICKQVEDCMLTNARKGPENGYGGVSRLHTQTKNWKRGCTHGTLKLEASSSYGQRITYSVLYSIAIHTSEGLVM